MNPLSFHTSLLAQAVQGAQGVEAELAREASSSSWMIPVLFLAVLGLPVIGGILAEKLLGLKNIAGRVGVVLFALLLGLTPFVTRMLAGGSPLDAVRLGIDLAGGTNMVFAVDREGAEAAEKDITGETGAAVMDRMVGTIARRINKSGTEEVTVRRVGQDRIEIIVPGADSEQAEQIKRDVTKLGELEFAILADRREDSHLPIIELAEQTDAADVRNTEGAVIAQWRPVAMVEGKDELKPVYPSEGNVTRTVTTRDGKEQLQFLVVVDPDPARRITGRLLKQARETIGESGPVVGFTFNTRGGHLFQQVTTRYQPREGAGFKHRLAVLLNKEIHSAPQINSIIGASGIIEGQFTSQEIEALVNVLNAGALEAPLQEQPISEFTVSPLLGVDVQEKGLNAIMISAIAVFVFMLAYYWWAGLVANVCLLMNLILTVGTMSFINATFTLPGLAGLVLTIGMAVDANVLIFERIREEQRKGSSLRMSIQNGFARALSAIVDSNVTTLITAVILYMVGSEQIRGFAVTLFIGIVMSMFTAVYVGRLIFDIMERKRWITDLRMASFVGKTNWDFVGKAKVVSLASLALIVVGMGAFFARGEDNLDIDFRGGSMVTFRFEDTPSVDEVREALAGKFDSSISLEQLQLPGDDGADQTMYRLRTVEPDADKVAATINEAFSKSPHALVRQHLEYGQIETIPAPEEPVSTEEAPPAAADPFAGGHRAQLTFSEPISATSVLDEASDALLQLKDEQGTPRFASTESLLEVVNNEDEFDTLGRATEFTIKADPQLSAADLEATLASLSADLSSRPNFVEKNTFDSSVAGEVRTTALMAMIFSMIAIVAYVWFRFQQVYFGIAAVTALVHDVLCVMALLPLAAYLSGNPLGQLLALDDFKVNLTIVAALMTIVGYSLNDTIVIFDRIREIRGKNPAMTRDIVNRSLNETLSRTVLTALTTLLVVGILYAIGGEGIHGFAFCMVLGVFIGTYSTVYIATPMLLWLMNRQPATR